MRWIARLSVRGKLTLVIGVCVAGFAAYGVVAVETMNVVKVSGPLYAEIVDGKDLTADIMPPPLSLAGAVRTLTMAIADGDPASIDREAALFKRLKAEFETRMAFWSGRLPEGPLREALMRKVVVPAQEWFQIAEERVWPLLASGSVRNANAIRVAELRPRFLKHQQGIEEVLQRIEQANRERETLAREMIDKRLTMLGAMAIGVIGLVVLMAMTLQSSILRPLHAMQAVMQDVASRWDLTVRAPVSSRDEIGQTCKAFNEVLERLQASLHQVAGASASVARAVEALSTQTKVLSRGGNEQTQQAVQASASVEELSTTIAELARHAQQVSTQAQAAAESADQGHAIVTRTMTGMTQLGETIQRSAQLVQELGRRSEQIGHIVNIIEEIAEQTNLLALNAAIEAARAGDQGRGFAVVADEVRKLAERTTTATREIAETIRTIQRETGHAVTAMRDATKETEGGIELAKSAGQRLGDIVQAVQSVTGMVQQIATAVEEQSTASRQIAGHIEAVAQVTTRSHAGLSEINRAADDLTRTASELRRLVAGFTLRDELADELERSDATL